MRLMKSFMQLLAECDESAVGAVQSHRDSSIKWTFWLSIRFTLFIYTKSYLLHAKFIYCIYIYSVYIYIYIYKTVNLASASFTRYTELR